MADDNTTAPLPAAPVQKHDEGEPQTQFTTPQEGGSYTRSKDGKLTLNSRTKPGDASVADEAAKKEAERKLKTPEPDKP